MGEIQTLEQFREWIRGQCRKDVDPQFGDNMVAEFEKIIRADTIQRAAIQAAVDDVQRAFAPCACGACLTCDLRAEHGEVIDDVISDVFGKLRHHTGVTPSEVPNA